MAWRGSRPGDTSDLVVGVLGSVGAVALVTAAIGVLDEWIPVLSLGALYVFAVLLVAVAWGLAYALPVAIASMLAFNWFFLEPTHTFHLRPGEADCSPAADPTRKSVAPRVTARLHRRADFSPPVHSTSYETGGLKSARRTANDASSRLRLSLISL